MTLDVETPDPPSLKGPQSRGEYDAIDMTDREPEDDFRREEIQTILADGAWEDAFVEWSAGTYLSEDEFSLVADLGLIDAFDFFWDPATDEVGYRSPAVPGDLPAGYDAAVDEADRDGIEEELDTLGRIVTERLENDYLLRDDQEFGFFADDYTGSEGPEGDLDTEE